MSVSHELEGQHVSFVLPVTLSPGARREVLLHTGVAPKAEQIFVIRNLTDLAPEVRARIVDTWEKVNVHVGEEERYFEDGEPYLEITGARNDGYLWLQRNAQDRWTRYLPKTDGESIDVDAVFYATPGRTIGALEHLRATLDVAQAEVLEAMLAGAPLVHEIGDGNSLRADHVLDAYARAMDLAQQLIDVVDAGIHAPVAWESYEITDDGVFLFPDPRQEQANRPAAIVKAADAEAYASARELLAQLDGVPDATVTEKIDRVCFHWWSGHTGGSSDKSKVETLLKMAVTNALNDVRVEQAKREAAERYEQCRSRWIDKHGSQRLKRAAARGYRHDGIYRDERLQLELPDFVGSLGRKPTIRELVNPSEHALELEAQVLARAEALGIGDDKVRLVFAQPGQDSDWADGEFVQIEGYLGRHTVWQSVSGKRDEIPF